MSSTVTVAVSVVVNNSKLSSSVVSLSVLTTDTVKLESSLYTSSPLLITNSGDVITVPAGVPAGIVTSILSPFASFASRVTTKSTFVSWSNERPIVAVPPSSTVTSSNVNTVSLIVSSTVTTTSSVFGTRFSKFPPIALVIEFITSAPSIYTSSSWAAIVTEPLDWESSIVIVSPFASSTVTLVPVSGVTKLPFSSVSVTV